MRSIRIFDRDLKLLAEIESYDSFSFERKFRTYGTFRIRINLNFPNTEFLQMNNLILVQGSSNKIGIIKQRSIGLSEDGQRSEILEITGFTLDYLFSKRIVVGTQNINSNSETIIKTFINDNCVNSIDNDRNYDFLTIAANQNRGSIFNWSARYTYLLEEISKINFNDNIGVVFNYNKTEILVDVVKSKDKTITSASPVIFAVEYDNIKTQVLTEDDLNYVNFAFIAGAGEGESRVTTTVGDGIGIDRQEMFYNNSGSEILELQAEATREMAALSKVFNMEGDILSVGPFIYERDWDLGDKVTIKNEKWGVQKNIIITGITEIYQGNELNINVEFGDNSTTLIDKVKSKFINVENEVRK